jgi:hypothetical protein
MGMEPKPDWDRNICQSSNETDIIAGIAGIQGPAVRFVPVWLFGTGHRTRHLGSSTSRYYTAGSLEQQEQGPLTEIGPKAPGDLGVSESLVYLLLPTCAFLCLLAKILRST